MDIGAEEIRAWHVDERGWSDIGYHYVIRRNGRIELGRDLGDVGAHVRGYNSVSVGICLVGGIDETGEPEDNFTPSQKQAMDSLVAVLGRIYGPLIEVAGHCDLDPNKDCPCFDVKKHFRRVT